MMNNQDKNYQGLPKKSTLWIVATIWANIIIFFLILGLTSLLLRVSLIQLFGLIVAEILMGLIWILTLIFAIRLGVKSVLKKSIIKKEKIVKISIWVAVIPFVLITGILSFYFLKAAPLLSPEKLLILKKSFLRLWIEGILLSAIYFVITYYWSKKLTKNL